MGWTDFFRRKKAGSSTGEPETISTSYGRLGIRLSLNEPLSEATVVALFEAAHEARESDAFLATYIAQLAQEGLCQIDLHGVAVPWAQIYALKKDHGHAGAIEALGLPPVLDVRPILNSRGSLSDPGFELWIDGWVLDGRETQFEALVGAVATHRGERFLVPQSSWELAEAVATFAERTDDKKNQHEQELSWGAMRSIATHAEALYASRYLESTVVLTPQTLRLPLARADIAGTRVLTVNPTFEGAPNGWISSFDGFREVQDHYDLAEGGGLVRVVISEPVKKVLRVIKREMPGRRVAGASAEKFIHNPWAYLGDAAQEVIREDEFLIDKASAGPVTSTFSLRPDASDGRLQSVVLVVTEHFLSGPAKTEDEPFDSHKQLAEFCESLECALQADREFFPWGEYDLAIDGESARQLEEARHLVHLWSNQPAKKITYDEVYEFAGYSERIEGIGAARPIYVPVFQKKKSEEDGSWIPTDLIPVIAVALDGSGERVNIPVTPGWVKEFEQTVAEAEKAGRPMVQDGTLPKPVSTAEARTLVDAFRNALDAQEGVKVEVAGNEKKGKQKRETLLVKTNFHAVDYLEERAAILRVPEGRVPVLPASLRPTIQLRKHQCEGVAWFQHLASLAPRDCRGALLADDMGLGKTLQLLCLVGRHYEVAPTSAPTLVVAPKSLLENWRNEARRFFTPAFPEVLVLYGDELESRKQPLSLIDEQLQSKGITDLLCPSWVGSAKMVVTTYEVLVRYEFSFAKQPFAFVICDEAQRIKNPSAQVTLAARKLNAGFRIACTGTPVENSLNDLWCLFDFVQPGLLGGLEDFARTYRKPIECDTEELEDALERLKLIISPQTLRRTKVDIASDLPKKYFAHSEDGGGIAFSPSLDSARRLNVPLSMHQLVLYKGGLKRLQDANREESAKKRARLSFAALHLMKAVCAEPYCIPGRKFLLDEAGLETHLANSRKMAWLLEHLEVVRSRDEKAIVFTELREVQNALAFFLKKFFGLKPFIINGDSQERQAFIDRFSAGSGFNVIVLSTLAAGAGLNVTAANHVIHFTRAWNPSKENQATDRAFRIGQEKDVFVYCPVMVTDEFDTFEVRLDEIMKRKAHLADATLGASSLHDMLHGTGPDVRISEILRVSGQGEAVPMKNLTLQEVDRLDGDSFEHLCKLLWAKQGYVSNVTPKAKGDGGIDVVAQKGGDGYLIQCKSSKNQGLGWDAVKEVVAGAAMWKKRFVSTTFIQVALTNQTFNEAARRQAELNGVRLIERQELGELLRSYPISNRELEDELQEAFA